jgi:hypothetical protein
VSTSPAAPEPLFSVVRGLPSEEELAALVAVLATLPPPVEPQRAAVRPSGWSDRSRALHAPLAPGPGAWLASARRD